jgi:hypothetical protein
MNSSLMCFSLSALMLLSGVTGLVVAQQTPGTDAKQFSKDGLTFSYANGWVLDDASNADAQQFNLARAGTDAQFRLFVFRPRVNSPSKLAEARKVLVDAYVASTFKTFEQMGARPVKAPASLDIGPVKSEGVRISATLDGEPGATEIYWGVVGERLVVLTKFGPDSALQKAAPAWDTLRNSIVVQDPKPVVQDPTPKATPSPQ